MKQRKIKLVAEIGCNHMGQLDLAKLMIDQVKQAGVDYVKFQKRDNKTLLTNKQYYGKHPVPHNSFGKTYGEHREYLEFNTNIHKELFHYCKKKKIKYSCSVWDVKSAKQISKISKEYIKVPSATNLNFPVLDFLCTKYFGDIHVSTGMTSEKEIDTIFEFIKKRGRLKNLVLYSCVSAYPNAIKDVCLLDVAKLTKQKKILLIFDEMWTGFRIHLGGAQAYFKIEADLVCYSKAIANGMPISVLGGSKRVMSAFQKKSFFYTTFGGEVLSIAAALECIKILKKRNVCKTIEVRGIKLINEMNKLINEHNLNFLDVKGYGARSILNIQHEKSMIIKTFIHQEFLKRGILWNGIISLSLSHNDLIINKILKSFEEILKLVKKIGLNKLNKNLNGDLIKKLIL